MFTSNNKPNPKEREREREVEVESRFKLPIFYNSHKKEINETITNDLELTKTITNKEVSIYSHVFKPSTCFGEMMLSSFGQYYTTDISFLKDTQTMLQKYTPLPDNMKHLDAYDFQRILEAWKEIKGETGFCEKYLYIDWEFGKFLNTNPQFLQAMSIYNIISPILSLFLPIIILIVPFFIIKLKGLHLSMQEYVDILKIIVSNHAIGKMFTSFHEVDMNQKVYLIISAAFYVFSIYQNILICIRFYSNMKKIHDYLFLFKDYLKYTIYSMDSYLEITNELQNYSIFNNELNNNKNVLLQFHDQLTKITELKFSLKKTMEIGHVMKCFYDMYEHTAYNDAFMYSFGFHGYLNNISGLKRNIDDKHIHACKFINKDKYNHNRKNKHNKKNIFEKAYYPNLISCDHIKNNCNLNKSMIITGPNASGKTTMLKTILINSILSQQFGNGCYKKAKIIPYDFLHCYLNIPDTSGRDSLFQAEARRCKEIIDCVNENKDKSHLCIFDELYSGTNPEEATISAVAFMEYLVKHKNVSCLLTTHYIDVCKKLTNNVNIVNYNMKTIVEKDKLSYEYVIQEGISEIKGGLKVLSDMNYPFEIINKTTNI